MKKEDYSAWFEIKNYVNNKKQRSYFHEREIWFCYLGKNIGFEQNGIGRNYLRPIVILKKFNSRVCLIVPLTKKIKVNKYYFIFYFTRFKSNAIMSQIRLVDSRRLKYVSGYMNKRDHEILKQKIRQLLA